MEHIERLLGSLPELIPIKTSTGANYSKEKGIKAIIFDIYGTLLVSSSGDIDQAELSTDILSQALEASNIEVTGNATDTLVHILNDLEYTINVCHTEAKKHNVPYPEIDILSIWEIVLLHAKKKGLIKYNGDANVLRMTCIFEFLSNKVYPMPGMKDVIKQLKAKGFPMGIVSNAQFYTPVVMNYFLSNRVGLAEEIDFFDPELTVFSYRKGIGKPDPRLFASLPGILDAKYGIAANQVLFVGNDMLKDIYTSKQSGFKTVLFAGDKRSLRLRQDDERTAHLKPDHIITELNQLLNIVN